MSNIITDPKEIERLDSAFTLGRCYNSGPIRSEMIVDTCPSKYSPTIPQEGWTCRRPL